MCILSNYKCTLDLISNWNILYLQLIYIFIFMNFNNMNATIDERKSKIGDCIIGLNIYYIKINEK